jgi:hypothetical protein
VGGPSQRNLSFGVIQQTGHLNVIVAKGYGHIGGRYGVVACCNLLQRADCLAVDSKQVYGQARRQSSIPGLRDLKANRRPIVFRPGLA